MCHTVPIVKEPRSARAARAAGTWDRLRAAHLYRRAGFGGSPEELDLAVSLGREGAVSRLVDFERISSDGLEAYLSLFGFDPAGFSQVPFDRESELRRWWYLRMQYTPRPLEEKMTLFWHNHFATSVTKVGEPALMYQQNQVFRTLGMGRFADLLLEVSRDPAMLIWLDNASSVKGRPNENFAREVMELFTMGRGNYTQNDVRESARALTGWTVDPSRNYRFYYDPNLHDDGAKTFLGQLGYFKPEDVIAILAARPETVSFITTKLARFFLGGDPSPELEGELKSLFVSTGGEIREIVRAILLSDDFDATADAPDQIKSPAEFIIGLLRAIGAYTDAGAEAGYVGGAMGQTLFRPPNVAGWKGGKGWVYAGAYLFRINYSFGALTSPTPWGSWWRWEPGKFFEDRKFASPDALIDFLFDRLSLIPATDGLRDVLRTFLKQAADPFDWNPTSYDYAGRGALYLVLASPEYQVQ